MPRVKVDRSVKPRVPTKVVHEVLPEVEDATPCLVVEDGIWRETTMGELRRWDVFSLRDELDQLLMCLDNPYYNSDEGIWKIRYEPLDRAVIEAEFEKARKGDK